jgi:class 3 adenylate cyclase/pimeloyl-ACP methyl ester carboxylesterase
MNAPNATKTTPTRELAAIMFSDIVGYTAIMGRDEQQAMVALVAHRELLRRILPRFNGRMLGEIGDGTLTSFHSALDAVNCARELQLALVENPDLRLRIGIHIGDVLFGDNNVWGDGVNVASRIHAVAPPGGICVSQQVYYEIRNKPGMHAKPLGQRRLKNVHHPVVIYLLDTGFRTPAKRPLFLRRRAPWILGAAAGLTVLAYLFYLPIATAAALLMARMQSPRLQIGYATTSDGVRIAYGTVGNGPPVVIVLGWLTDLERGSTSPTYNSAFLMPIAARHLVVQYDGRGFGRSDRGLKDYSLEPRVRDLEAVVDALKLKRFALFAISAGGAAAVAYTARHPQRITRVVLYGTHATPDPTLLTPVERRRLEAVFTLLTNGWDNPAFLEMLSSLTMPNATELQRHVFAEMARISGTPEDSSACLVAMAKDNITALAPSIRAPTLVLHVRGDEVAPLAYGMRLASLIPGARLMVLEGKDHIPVPGDGEYEPLARALGPFLDRDNPPRTASTSSNAASFGS